MTNYLVHCLFEFWKELLILSLLKILVLADLEALVVADSVDLEEEALAAVEPAEVGDHDKETYSLQDKDPSS